AGQARQEAREPPVVQVIELLEGLAVTFRYPCDEILLTRSICRAAIGRLCHASVAVTVCFHLRAFIAFTLSSGKCHPHARGFNSLPTMLPRAETVKSAIRCSPPRGHRRSGTASAPAPCPP